MLVGAAGTAAVVASGLLAAPVQAGVNVPATVSVVIDHLNNPRGLALAKDGSLLLVEAGNGGPQCIDKQTCIGNTGSIDRITNLSGTAQRDRFIRGLISAGDPSGMAASGPAAVTTGYGTFIVFSGNTQQIPPGASGGAIGAARTQLGQFAYVGGSNLKTLAPVGDQDYRWSGQHKSLAPHDFPDSNPNAVLVYPNHEYVIDAGANTLTAVSGGGSQVTTFFPVPAGAQSDAVPTCLAKGPDGALYVGELLGGFYAPGHARIWRVVPGHAPTVWATGLTAVNGCGFTPDGAFYAVEFQTHGLSEDPSGNPAGDVVQIVNGRMTHLGVGHLNFPSGFAPAPGHGIFVSDCSIAPAKGFGPCPNGGRVVRIG